jgi:hypothetical protein
MLRHVFIAICVGFVSALPLMTAAYGPGPYEYRGDLPFQAYLEGLLPSSAAHPALPLVASAAPRNRWPSRRVFFVAVRTDAEGSFELSVFRCSYLVHLIDDPGGLIICG